MADARHDPSRRHLLQQAAADGAGRRPDADRALTQARRAAEKAARLLRGLADDAG